MFEEINRLGAEFFKVVMINDINFVPLRGEVCVWGGTLTKVCLAAHFQLKLPPVCADISQAGVVRVHVSGD